MPLSHPAFSANARIRSAAENAPPMRRGESDAEAVRILQQALVAMEAGRLARSRLPDGSLDGDYGGETYEAVKQWQRMSRRRGHYCDIDGMAGRQTWVSLDALAPRPLPAPAIAATPETRVPPPETPASVDTGRDVGLPSAAAMEATYRSYRHDQPGYRGRGGLPCHQPVANQCAVRMSIALGINAPNFELTPQNCRWTHRAGNGACQLAEHHNYPHNTGAQRLYDYISTLWTFHTYRGVGSRILEQVSGRKGIMFFRDCGRTGNPNGDHIDYWDGTHVMNDLLRYNARGEVDPEGAQNSRRWFRNSASVHFCPLPD